VEQYLQHTQSVRRTFSANKRATAHLRMPDKTTVYGHLVAGGRVCQHDSSMRAISDKCLFATPQ
jgi:hypothetical protein